MYQTENKNNSEASLYCFKQEFAKELHMAFLPTPGNGYKEGKIKRQEYFLYSKKSTTGWMMWREPLVLFAIIFSF